MAALSIRDLDDGVKERLRVQAAHNGRSMEAEARTIIAAAVGEPDHRRDFITDWINSFAALGGVKLELPPRDGSREPPDFS